MDWILPQGFSSPSKTDIGFLYRIIHPGTGRIYIGRKLFWTKKTVQKNLKKKRVTVESDWRGYWGSSPTLAEMIERDGKEGFRREMLILAGTKSELAYLETYCIMRSNAIMQDRYINEWFSARITRAHLKKVSEGLIAKVGVIDQMVEGWNSPSFSNP